MADSLLVGRNFVSGIFKNLKKTQIKKLGFCQPCQLVTPKPCSHYLHYPGQGWKTCFYSFLGFCVFFSFLRLLCFNLHMPDTKLRPTSKDSAIQRPQIAIHI